MPTRAEVAEAIGLAFKFLHDLIGGNTDRIDEVEGKSVKEDARLDARIDKVDSKIDTTAESILNEIRTIELTPGEPGKNADPEEVKRLVLEELVLPEPQEAEPITSMQVRNLLESLPEGDRFEAQFIDGLEQLIKKLAPSQQVRIFGGRVGMHMFIDGTKIGVVNTLNLLAGDGITFDYLNQNGILTLTINGATGGGAWTLGEQLTLGVDNKSFTLAHAPTSKLEVLLDRQPQVPGLDITGTINGTNKDFAFVDAVDSSLLTNIYANYQ